MQRRWRDAERWLNVARKAVFPLFQKTNSKFCFDFLKQNAGNNLLPFGSWGQRVPSKGGAVPEAALHPDRSLGDAPTTLFPSPKASPTKRRHAQNQSNILACFNGEGNPLGCSRLSRRQRPGDRTLAVGQNKPWRHPALRPHPAPEGWLCRHGDTGHREGPTLQTFTPWPAQLSNLPQTRTLTTSAFTSPSSTLHLIFF